jgi:hypothetical protein
MDEFDAIMDDVDDELTEVQSTLDDVESILGDVETMLGENRLGEEDRHIRQTTANSSGARPAAD